MEQETKKRKKGKWIVLIVVLIILIVGITSCASCMNSLGSGDKTDVVDASDQNDTNASDTKKDSEENKVKELTEGKSFEENGLKITLKKVDTNFTDYDDDDGYYTPKKGMKYVMASFAFENTGNSDRYVSIYDFECYADDEKCEPIFELGDADDVDYANLSAGRKASFKVYYVVPKDAKSIELEYETDIWTDEKAVIKLK